MQFFIAALIGGLWAALGSLVGRVLVSLGLGYATYVGVDSSITWMRFEVVTRLQGLGSQTLAVMGALQVGRCISIICSALLMRLTFQGLKAGAIKRIGVK